MTPQFSVAEKSPSYWAVTFENGPVNLLDADSIDELADLVTQMEVRPRADGRGVRQCQP
jgi:hypothetical protein